jgi:hypothetical protein
MESDGAAPAAAVWAFAIPVAAKNIMSVVHKKDAIDLILLEPCLKNMMMICESAQWTEQP